jgi:hydrogen peroxide-dependent heme synthase
MLPSTTPNPANPLSLKEGLYVLHLFYRVDRQTWASIAPEERQQRWNLLEQLVETIRQEPQTQLLTIAMIAKADLGFMLISPNLHALLGYEKRLAQALGAEVLQPVFSFFSLTEQSEYTTTEAEYVAELAQQGLTSDSPAYAEKMAAFAQRIKHYTQDRMYPTLPAWEFFCFYPMAKRREGTDNWYALGFEARKALMKGHATVGRKYAGKVSQLITGCTGLDDWEWGVTLFAHDPFEVKAIVSEMRFDEVTVRYGEFGEFYTGLPLPLEVIYKRLDL